MKQLSRFIEILRARRVLVAAVFGAVVLLDAALILFIPKAYTARVSLVTDTKGVDAITGATSPVTAADATASIPLTPSPKPPPRRPSAAASSTMPASAT